MASFLVFQDQENEVGLGNVKSTKDAARPTQKRSVLGDINRKNGVENTNPSFDGSVFQKAIKSQNVFNVARPKETNEKNKVYEQLRSPLRDLTVSDLESKDDEKTLNKSESGTDMSIDKSPSIQFTPTLRQELEELYDCSEYRDDIYRYLRKLEMKHRPKAYYMRRQPDVTYSMRAILVDWLVEVGEEYKLHNETLFMAVSYIDRFLSLMAVVRAKLQLLGTSAMFIASKFEEIYPPEVAEFTYITDDTYTKKQVLRMEHLILKVLSFNLSCPTAYTFVLHIAVSAALPEQTVMFAVYLCELTLLEADPYLQYNPSLIACAAIALARHCLGHVDIWSAALEHVSNYKLAQLAPVVAHLNSTHAKAASVSPHAITEKYKSSKYLSVSLLPCKKLVIRDNSVPNN